MKLNYAEEIESMTDNELVAFWNILQFPSLVSDPEPDKELLVSHELSSRDIPHEKNRRTVKDH